MSRPAERTLRADAEAIWHAAVAAVRPDVLIHEAFADERLGLRETVAAARRIVIVGGGKAGAAMAAAVEQELGAALNRAVGLVNVPAATVFPLQRIKLHAARAAGINQPTAEGVAGANQILELVAQAGADDLVLCLLSGGGSALLPAPVDGISLEDKQRVTLMLHACGATINEMNAVRKHLSKIKGGRLAQAFRGGRLISLIISDVVGDPLDVIASGPTAADPTSFADALSVLTKYDLIPSVPETVRRHLELGAAGRVPETPKTLPKKVQNIVIGNNARALAAGVARAKELGYAVVNLGPDIQGETRQVAREMASMTRSIAINGQPVAPPACLLSGGETTVTLGPAHGLGGRNQEFALAAALNLGEHLMKRVAVLSGGTDGEDGPTDAAGAVADGDTLTTARRLGLPPEDFLGRHDAYHFFEAAGHLLRTGLTQTNVMDVRVLLVADQPSATLTV